MKYILILMLLTSCLPPRKPNGDYWSAWQVRHRVFARKMDSAETNRQKRRRDLIYDSVLKADSKMIEGYYKSGCHLGGGIDPEVKDSSKINTEPHIWQKIHTDIVTIKTLEATASINKSYNIHRDFHRNRMFVYFDTPWGGGSEGWAFEIIDSTNNGIYILGPHWMTTFDSLQVSDTKIRLFNRTLDEIIYIKNPHQ